MTAPRVQGLQKFLTMLIRPGVKLFSGMVDRVTHSDWLFSLLVHMSAPTGRRPLARVISVHGVSRGQFSATAHFPIRTWGSVQRPVSGKDEPFSYRKCVRDRVPDHYSLDGKAHLE
jgi:hypothetical protein